MTDIIRKCTQEDFEGIYTVINDGAQAYRGIIPDDRWKDPYMSIDELKKEIADGVVFWGYEDTGTLIGVMGIQDRGEVDLIRHAYVLTDRQGQGVGTRLLKYLEHLTSKPVLMGTWADASWAIRFYAKHGYRLVSPEEKDRLLKKYWTIPARQIDTSVVLGDSRWFGNSYGIV
jgi:GNAT superfamily N-acetyltransferase